MFYVAFIFKYYWKHRRIKGFFSGNMRFIIQYVVLFHDFVFQWMNKVLILINDALTSIILIRASGESSQHLNAKAKIDDT